jgi:hypothetical protein
LHGQAWEKRGDRRPNVKNKKMLITEIGDGEIFWKLSSDSKAQR